MTIKILLAATAVSSLLLAQPQTANAETVSTAQLESPAYHQAQYGYPGQWHPPYDDGYDDEDEYSRISCWEGRRVVRRAGYHRVQNVSCYGDIYRYSAVRRGFLWRIAVDADTGDIVRTRRIRPIYTTY